MAKLSTVAFYSHFPPNLSAGKRYSENINLRQRVPVLVVIVAAAPLICIGIFQGNHRGNSYCKLGHLRGLLVRVLTPAHTDNSAPYAVR